MNMRQRAVALLAACATAVFPAACAPPKDVLAPAAQPPEASSSDVLPTATGLPVYSAPETWTTEAIIAANWDVVTTVQEASERLGADLSLPDRLGGFTLQRIIVSRPQREYAQAFFEYDGYLTVEIDELTARDATESMKDDDEDPNFSLYCRKVVINGFEGRMSPRLDVAPKDDAAGRKVLGTGVYRSQSSVVWAVGKYLVTVRYPGSSPDGLLPLARQVSLRPR